MNDGEVTLSRAERVTKRSTVFHMAVSTLSAALVTAGVVALDHPSPAAAAPAGGDHATVVDVVDGDTVDVTLRGREVRIRLLNVDTPETVDPNQPVECLGPEASATTKGLLPSGTGVTLRYDQDRTDRYGRTLATVTTDAGVFVNAELARQGLAEVKVFGGNDRYLPAITHARDEAVTAGRGLYSAQVDCTAVAQVQRLTQQAQALPPVPTEGAPFASLADAAAQAAVLYGAASLLQNAATADAPGIVWDALPKETVQHLITQVMTATRTARATTAAITTRLEPTRSSEAAAVKAQREAAQRAAEEAARAAAEKAAADRAAADKAAADKAAADRAAADAAAAAAKRAATTPRTSSSPRPTPRSAPPSQQSDPAPAPAGGAGYTGCRSYGPGGIWVDKKGQRYSPISCN